MSKLAIFSFLACILSCSKPSKENPDSIAQQPSPKPQLADFRLPQQQPLPDLNRNTRPRPPSADNDSVEATIKVTLDMHLPYPYYTEKSFPRCKFCVGDPNRFTVEISWDSGDGYSSWTRVGEVSQRNYTKKIGRLRIGQSVDLKARVLGDLHEEVYQAEFESDEVWSSGNLWYNALSITHKLHPQFNTELDIT